MKKHDNALTTLCLDEIFEFRNGMNFDESMRGDYVRLVGVADFAKGGFDQSDLKGLSENANVSDESLLRDDDLLFVRSNGSRELVGRCMRIVNLAAPTTYSGFTIRARWTRSVWDARLCHHLFDVGKGLVQLRRLLGGTNISNLSQAMLSKVQLPLFSDERTVAVCQIGCWFDKQKNDLKNRISISTNRKAGLMREMLSGRRRFPAFVEPLEDVSLSELFSERVDRDNSDLELLSVTAKDGIVLRDSLDRKDTSAEDKSSYKRVAPGDIAYNTMRMWQGVSAMVDREGIVSPAYTVVTPKERISTEYAARLFKTPRVIHEFLRYSQGLVDDTLNLKFHHFSEVCVKLPKSSEQDRIVELLKLIDREIELLIRQRSATEKLKRGVMERLLSGEVIIPDDVVERLNLEAEEEERQRAKDAKRAAAPTENAS